MSPERLNSLELRRLAIRAALHYPDPLLSAMVAFVCGDKDADETRAATLAVIRLVQDEEAGEPDPWQSLPPESEHA